MPFKSHGLPPRAPTASSARLYFTATHTSRRSMQAMALDTTKAKPSAESSTLFEETLHAGSPAILPQPVTSGEVPMSSTEPPRVIVSVPESPPAPLAGENSAAAFARDPVSRAKRAEDRKREQVVYKISAIAASLGVTSLAIAAVYYRFAWHMDRTVEFPWVEAAATLALTIGGAIAMELWAQYAHKALWHDFEPGWNLHKSHHVPRIGPFEDNDVFAVINALPAMGLCAYGFLTPGVSGGLCFGAGLGITLFGISYMFIHDGLVHRRFPVGPIAEVPYLKRVAIAHTLHHSEKYNGVPWGLFLGPRELEAVGGGPELDKMCASAKAIAKHSGPSRDT